MARYVHLLIYQAALDLTVHFEKVVAGFSRYHKYTLGTHETGPRQRTTAIDAQVSLIPGPSPGGRREQ